jgi:excisionase family DNA binding protein
VSDERLRKAAGMPKDPRSVRMLSTKEVAERLRCSEATIARRVADGTLPAVRIGRLVRIREDVLEGMIEAATIVPARIVGG